MRIRRLRARRRYRWEVPASTLLDHTVLAECYSVTNLTLPGVSNRAHNIQVRGLRDVSNESANETWNAKTF
jgi:hypothetical protein